MSENEWHGMTGEQWLASWDSVNWREHLIITLRSIALDPRAGTPDRLGALQTINEAILNGALPPDPAYPELMRDVLLAVTLGDVKGKKKHRRRAHARLLGARWMLQTAYQFLPKPDAKPAAVVIDMSKYS